MAVHSPGKSTTAGILTAWRDGCPQLLKLWPEKKVQKWAGLTFAEAPDEHVLLKIHLPGQGLTWLPNELGEIKSLGYLNLRDNKLTSLPPSLGDFSWLTFLNLERNILTHIPPEMGKLDRLKTLHLAGNPWRFRDPLPDEWKPQGDMRTNGGCDFRR
jgi:hypothetical protein